MIRRIISAWAWHRFQCAAAKAIAAEQSRHGKPSTIRAKQQAIVHAALAGGKR